MFLVNWFKGILSSLGLYKKSGKILFLGLDNAGKSTLLKVLKDGKVAQVDPTKHVKTEEVEMGSIRFKAFDLGGHDIARTAWKGYFAKVDGIIYLIDSTDKDRIALTKKELYSLFETKELQKVPIVILGNKIDKKDAMSEEELRAALELDTEYLTKTGRPVELFMCSVVKKAGHTEGFKWLGKYLN